MRTLLLFCFSSVIVWSLSCRDRGEANTARANTERVISALTPERLTAFGQWTYSGKGNVWFKGSMAQVETTTRFEERNDSLILTVRKPEAFIKEFQLDIPLERRLHGLTLVKSVDTCFFISEDALIGPYRWTTLDCATDTVFRQGNPFSFFRELTQLKDSLGIVQTEQGGTGAIRFYLQDGSVLTYSPEGAAGGTNEEAGRGERIDKNWSLRRRAEAEDR